MTANNPKTSSTSLKEPEENSSSTIPASSTEMPPMPTASGPNGEEGECLTALHDSGKDNSLELLSGLASEMSKLSEKKHEIVKKRAAPGADSAEPRKTPRRREKAESKFSSKTATATSTTTNHKGTTAGSPSIIQDWHAVIGDKHSGNPNRTTTATKLIKQVKQWYKQNKALYRNEGRSFALLDDALDLYMTKAAQQFGQDFPATREDRLATILIHCSHKAMESGRVRVPNCFQYEKDAKPAYGIAKIESAVTFFFESRDAPTLAYDVAKYRRELPQLVAGSNSNNNAGNYGCGFGDDNDEGLRYFCSLLDFCEDQMNKAKQQELARNFLELINMRTTLKQVWQSLKNGKGDAVNSSTNSATNEDADGSEDTRTVLLELEQV